MALTGPMLLTNMSVWITVGFTARQEKTEINWDFFFLLKCLQPVGLYTSAVGQKLSFKTVRKIDFSFMSLRFRTSQAIAEVLDHEAWWAESWVEVLETEHQNLASLLASKLVISVERYTWKKRINENFTLLRGYNFYPFQELFQQQTKQKTKRT